MKGADEYYNIVTNAYNHAVVGLKKLNGSWSGGDSEAFIYDHLVFVTSTHARGKCFQIYLVENPLTDVKAIKNNAFEVYGVVSGQPGWTEEYGYIHKGSWVNKIGQVLGNLQSRTDAIINEELVKKGEKLKKEQEQLKQKLNRFDKMFA